MRKYVLKTSSIVEEEEEERKKEKRKEKKAINVDKRVKYIVGLKLCRRNKREQK